MAGIPATTHSIDDISHADTRTNADSRPAAGGSPEDAAVRVTGLAKRLGAVQALAGVDLHVGWNETVAIVGPNGAGKTTLIRTLATIVFPDAGRATVAGHDVVEDGAAVRRAIGLVLGGERAWYWRLTSRQNLEFFAALEGLNRAEARRVATELLERLGLADASDRRVGRHSTGMRARLSLARALIGDPQVLILDEPTSSVDPVSAAAFGEELRALATTHRLAVLYATHDLREAVAADRVIALAGGRVAFELPGGGSPAELERALAEAVS